jgi:hypothetical protein
MKERRERMKRGARIGGRTMREALEGGRKRLGGDTHAWRRGTHA